jgi:hypothetical protein
MNRLNLWFNKVFFVKDPDAAKTMFYISFGLGLMADLSLVVWRQHDPNCFLNRSNHGADIVVRLFIGVAVTLIMMLSMFGVYNYTKRRRERRNKCGLTK